MKKQILLSAVFLTGMILVSCSNGSKAPKTEEDKNAEEQIAEPTAEITETTESTEPKQDSHLAVLKTDQILLPSQIKGSVEIVPEDDGNIYVDFDDYNYPKISLTFKLLKKVNTNSLVDQYGQMWIVGHAQDAKGRNIDDLNPKNISSREWRSGDSDGKEFKTFLEGDVDDTITLEFTGESNIELFEKDEQKIESGKKTTEEAAKELGKFKLSITGN